MNAAPDPVEPLPGPMLKSIELNSFPVPHGVDVVGTPALLRLQKGDTLPDIARHFSLGVNALSHANPQVDVWVPEPGRQIVLPLSFILPNAPRKGIVVNLATMRLFHFKHEGNALLVSTYPVGIGTDERPTPTGKMRVRRKAARPTWHVPVSISEDHRKKGDPLPAKVPPGPLNPLGECALYLSKAGFLIHGTNKPASIGLKATNGCMRLYPENAKVLCKEAEVSTAVTIVNQPYLLGLRDGTLYLEAHPPVDGSGSAELRKLFLRLRRMERKSGRTFDWDKIRKVQAEARGIPVPIMVWEPGNERASQPVEVEHPVAMPGKPEVPELRLDAWYVLAATVPDTFDALRIAAIINHQGPPIPARVFTKMNGNHVIAGPFEDADQAREAVRRLKIDLELDGILIEPRKKI